MSLTLTLCMSLDTGGKHPYGVTVFEAQLTSNLWEMARQAGLDEVLWCPYELGIRWSGEMVPYLKKGLRRLKRRPAHFIKMNPPNGWGSYETFLPWLEKLILACQTHSHVPVEVDF